MAKKILIVDGNAILHRAFHALPPLTDNQGRLINAVYGFFTILLKAIAELKVERLAICFDSSAPTFRHKVFAAYKAHRVEKPELYAQLPILAQLLKALKVPVFAAAGYEADDLVGTIAKQAQQEQLSSIILTGDLDTLQLVGPDSKVYVMRTGVSKAVMYDRQEIFKKYGLASSQMVDFKSLIGDPSDNIPGAKNIGPKTAAGLLKKFKTLKCIYQNLAKIAPSVAENLKVSQQQVLLAKKLVTIDADAPIQLALSKAKIASLDFKAVRAQMLSLGLKTLASRLPVKQAGQESQMNLL